MSKGANVGDEFEWWVGPPASNLDAPQQFNAAWRHGGFDYDLGRWDLEGARLMLKPFRHLDWVRRALQAIESGQSTEGTGAISDDDIDLFKSQFGD